MTTAILTGLGIGITTGIVVSVLLLLSSSRSKSDD